jgi:predicted nucleic-acid-binding Zn-ribbon protein
MSLYLRISAMPYNRDTCSKCGEKSILKGEIGLRTSKDKELIMVVRQDHGVEKSVPLQPSICCKCGFVDLYAQDPTHLKISSEDRPINPDFKQRPLLESDF